MRRIGWLALALAGAWPAFAQHVPLERVRPLREGLKAQISQARLHLGPLRLLPTLKLGGLGYTNNVTGLPGGPSDYYGTLSGGTRFVLPLGPDMYLHGSAIPSYTWYAHLKEWRAFGGLYGGELAAFFGRVTVVAGGKYSSSSVYVNTELQTPVVQSNGTGRLGLELEVLGRLSLLASADGNQFRYHPRQGELAYLSKLDSNGVAARGGVKYRFRAQFSISAQVEETRTTYPNEEGLRDNQTTGYLLGIGYDRPRFYINLSGGYRKGRPYKGSDFPDYGGATGSTFISYFLTRRVEIQLYGGQDLISSLYSDNPYYVETKAGGGLGVRLGHRLTLSGFGELSRNRYPVEQQVGSAFVLRRDEGRTYGGGIGIRLFRTTTFSVVAKQARYTSNIPGLDRSILTITSNVNLDAFQVE